MRTSHKLLCEMLSTSSAFLRHQQTRIGYDDLLSISMISCMAHC